MPVIYTDSPHVHIILIYLEPNTRKYTNFNDDIGKILFRRFLRLCSSAVAANRLK